METAAPARKPADLAVILERSINPEDFANHAQHPYFPYT